MLLLLSSVDVVAVPTIEVRVDWRKAGFAVLSNDGFETDTAGWSVAAGINAAATSITRTLRTSRAGVASADLLTTATLTSGCNFALTGTFTSGRTYRFRIAIQWDSGTTKARLRFGSLGTAADRATSAMTLTTSYVLYTVDWTPTADRTDAQVTVENDEAVIGTFRLDHAEVFETLTDISAYVSKLEYGRGASFDGATEAPGRATLTLKNSDQRFDPDSTTSALAGLVKLGRPVWFRATRAGVPYPMFYGIIRRIIPRPKDRLLDIYCEDELYALDRAETSITISTTRSLGGLRGAILDDIGEPAVRRSLSTNVTEQAIPLTGVDPTSALSALTGINVATGTVHFIRPSVSASVLYQYVTVARTSLVKASADGSALETLDGKRTGVRDVTGYDLTDELIINSQRVTPMPRSVGISATAWEMSGPITVDALKTVTLWPTFATTVLSAVGTFTATNAPTVTFTFFEKAAKVVITAGASASTVTAITITGQPVTSPAASSVERKDATSQTTYGPRKGSDISSDLLSTAAQADGLASWFVYRYKDPKAKPTLDVSNVFPTLVSRDITDRIALTISRLSLSSAHYLIRAFRVSVVPGTDWTGSYELEAAPKVVVWFTLGGTADEGIGGTGILAY